MTKHIFVTGGVVSSLGKGITAASLGRLLKARGYKVMMQKADPYLNVDPGTMSPFQHGEVFVTEDGKETDLDLGHYERFIDENLTRESNFTTGLIYQSLIQRERAGDFLGGTVQVIPHVTDAIKARFARIEEVTNADVVITELGGTIGDIESQPFVEAIRQFRKERGASNVAIIHVSLVPYIAAAHEVKTKPTQHSVKELRSLGIQPDFIVCRSSHSVDESIREKIANFCDVDADCVLRTMICLQFMTFQHTWQHRDLTRKYLSVLVLKSVQVILAAGKHLLPLCIRQMRLKTQQEFMLSANIRSCLMPTFLLLRHFTTLVFSMAGTLIFAW